MSKILVAYASFAGATREVAEAVARELENGGAAVEVRPAREVTDLSDYRAVVVGSAIRVAKLHPHAISFIKRHAIALSQRPVAYFIVCLTLQDETEENRQTVAGYLDAIKQEVPQVRPLDVGLFAGKLDPKKLNLLFRLMMKATKAPEGDFRNWPAIQAWAQQIRPALMPES